MRDASDPASAEATAAADGTDAVARPHAPRGALDQSALTMLVGYASTRAALSLKRAFRRHLGPLKLKAVEYSILVLVDTNSEVNQKQLGLALDVSPPNLAVTLDRMEARGWVRREVSERDRRSHLVRLTPRGQQLCTRAREVASVMEDEPLAVLSSAERAMLLELLQRVAAGPRQPGA